jgi:hypothetical protein
VGETANRSSRVQRPALKMKNKASMEFRPPRVAKDLREYASNVFSDDGETRSGSELGRRFLLEKVDDARYVSLPPRPSSDDQNLSPKRLQRENNEEFFTYCAIPVASSSRRESIDETSPLLDNRRGGRSARSSRYLSFFNILVVKEFPVSCILS